MNLTALTEFASLLAALDDQATAYPAHVLEVLRDAPTGPLARKLTENLKGWAALSAEERRARHLRALAIVGDALRASTTGTRAGERESERAGAADTPDAERTNAAPYRGAGMSGYRDGADSTSSRRRSRAEPTVERPEQAPIAPLDSRPSSVGPSARDGTAPLTTIKGIGEKKAQVLESKGLRTIDDLLTYLPFRYDLRVERDTLRGVTQGAGVLVAGHVLARGPVRMRRFPQAYRIEVALAGNERVALVWFRMSRPQQDFFARNFPVGAAVEAAGQLDFFDGRPSFMHPEVGKPGSLERGLLPVYSETEGITSKSFRQWIYTALDMLQGQIADPLPPKLRRALRLEGREQALESLHRPADVAANPLDPDYPPRRRLVFDEFLLMSLGLLIRRRGAQRESGTLVSGIDGARDEVEAALPFRLTAAQRKVVHEIGDDLASGHPMHRLVQGDVGSGKTLVALIAAAAVMKAGYQAALMAPTELLAEQHFYNAQQYLKPWAMNMALLTGSTPAKARRELAARLQAGSPMLVIGTHALLEEDAAFSRLALAIVDEQHRFGVRQRAKLLAKGMDEKPPHLLVMTATPIPRSLAMTLYGDLDVSVIDELPPGRTPVNTKLVVSEADRKGLMAHIKEQLGEGRQVYWVFPLIEESEKIDLKDATRAAELLQKALPQAKVELLHGRMSAPEKDEVMRRFKAGESDVLVATTVIEVGVDVPNASVMVIEHAERFGLSQLHQLRGRVGRGAARSTCYLRVDHVPHGDVAQRLHVMTDTNDGFKIAEVDLEIRGAGDLLGTKQSGLPSLHVANPVRDARTLAEARRVAEQILSADPDLEQADHQALRQMVETTWAGRLHLATSG